MSAPDPDAGELAAHIPPHLAQLCVVKALAAAGREDEWTSTTILDVLGELKPCLDALGDDVPDPYSHPGWSDYNDNDGWWRQVYES